MAGLMAILMKEIAIMNAEANPDEEDVKKTRKDLKITVNKKTS